MLPFIQCHQTRGLAAAGGFLKLRSNSSPAVCPLAGIWPTLKPARMTNPAPADRRLIALRVLRMISFSPLLCVLGRTFIRLGACYLSV